MLKFFSFLWAISIFIVSFHSFAFAQIIIEDASSIWEQNLETPTEIPAIPPRIVGEYATTIYHQDLVSPVELINITSSVPSRIVIEYASVITQFVLITLPDCEGNFDNDSDVDGSDLAVFAADFGRTNCDQGEFCEGDFDGDNDVDGSDLAVFAADFGNTSCPLYPSTLLQ